MSEKEKIDSSSAWNVIGMNNCTSIHNNISGAIGYQSSIFNGSGINSTTGTLKISGGYNSTAIGYHELQNNINNSIYTEGYIVDGNTYPSCYGYGKPSFIEPKKEIKRIYSDMDPYGEENWDE